MAVALAAAVGSLTACDPMPPNFCPDIAGLEKWTWNGTAADNLADASKWLRTGSGGDGIPGGRNPADDVDDYVCVKPNTVLTIRQSQSLHVQVLDSGGTINVETGAKVELRANPAVHQSLVRHVGLRGEWYGRGQVTVRTGGIFRWTSLPTGAAAMSTRETNAPIAGMPAIPGRTIISVGAKLIVDGRGVNFFDGRIIDNLGTTEITGNDAYVAADHGTTFNNVGTLDLLGDGDYSEGFGRGIVGLSQVTNSGSIRKTAGTGASVIDAAYSVAGSGSAQVSTGTLSILGGGGVASVAPSASVSPTFANGGCATANLACTGPAVTPTRPQFTALALPVGTATSTVTMTPAPNPGGKGLAVDLLVPTETASSVGTSPGPMVLRMALDSTLTAGGTAATITVDHDGVVVPDCTGGVQVQCVDRAASTTALGDVVLVIRTASNGRWKLL